MKTKNKKHKAHTRYYLKTGELVVGVTSVIDSQLGWSKRALIAWARRESLAGNDPNKILAEAGDVGTCTHYLIQCHITGKEPDLSGFTKDQIDKAENGFLAFLDWEESTGFLYEHIEFPVVSEQYRYGGTIDIITRRNGLLYLFDVKSARNIYPEHIIQISAYHHAYEEQEQEQIQKFQLLHVGKHDGSFAVHNIAGSQIAKGWGVFKLLRELYDLEKEFK